MKLDAHQHFWRYTPAEYGWINTDVVEIVADYSQRLSKVEQNKVWGGTAQKFYGVN